MPITATLLLCSCLFDSNSSGETATRHLSSVQQEVAAIKASSLSNLEKGKRLAVFIREGMAIEDVEKIVGRAGDEFGTVIGFGSSYTFYAQFDLEIIVRDGRVIGVQSSKT